MGKMMIFPKSRENTQQEKDSASCNQDGRMAPAVLVQRLQKLHQEITDLLQQTVAETTQFENNEEAVINTLKALLQAAEQIFSLIGDSQNLPLDAIAIRFPLLFQCRDAKHAVERTIQAVNIVRIRRGRGNPGRYEQAFEDAALKAEQFPSEMQKFLDATAELCQNIIAKSLL